MKPLGIYYEHPDWFRPLFEELERRQLPYVKIDARSSAWPIHQKESPYSLVFNRASPSAYLRGNGQTIFHTLDFISALESIGTPVINGSQPYSMEISKTRQLLLLEKLGLPYPKSYTVNSAEAALQAAAQLRFPIVLKANIGGSGAGITRYDSFEALKEAAEAGTCDLGIDHTALVQELSPLREGHIVRIEVLNGEFLYAIKVYPAQGSFDLCPADACETPAGQALVRGACAVDAPRRGLKVERAEPLPEMVQAALEIAKAIHLDVGGIEYLVDDRDGRPYIYDINALSNFVADAPQVVGFDPFAKLVDYIEYRMKTSL